MNVEWPHTPPARPLFLSSHRCGVEHHFARLLPPAQLPSQRPSRPLTCPPSRPSKQLVLPPPGRLDVWRGAGPAARRTGRQVPVVQRARLRVVAGVFAEPRGCARADGHAGRRRPQRAPAAAVGRRHRGKAGATRKPGARGGRQRRRPGLVLQPHAAAAGIQRCGAGRHGAQAGVGWVSVCNTGKAESTGGSRCSRSGFSRVEQTCVRVGGRQAYGDGRWAERSSMRGWQLPEPQASRPCGGPLAAAPHVVARWQRHLMPLLPGLRLWKTV
eukprot:365471-Chlamydomonas_euryale.AAC.30